MAVICPTVTAYDLHEYREQLERAVSVANRVHIDLMDGQFAPTVSPDLSRIWLPYESVADIHLMFQKPAERLEQLVRLNPNMVIIQAEAEVDHMLFASELHKHNIKAGLSVLQSTDISKIEAILHSFDHILVFSGDLGHHGGIADLSLLEKVQEIRQEFHDVEIGWDGGIDNENVSRLVEGDVDVLNVGGFIQRADDYKKAYQQLTDALL